MPSFHEDTGADEIKIHHSESVCDPCEWESKNVIVLKPSSSVPAVQCVFTTVPNILKMVIGSITLAIQGARIATGTKYLVSPEHSSGLAS